MKCCVYIPDYCFKMSYNVARQGTYLTHIIFFDMLYAMIHSRWCRKGEKIYAGLPPVFSFPLVNFFFFFLPQHVNPPLLPSCVIQFFLMQNMVCQLPGYEMRHPIQIQKQKERIKTPGFQLVCLGVWQLPGGYLDTHRMNALLGLLKNVVKVWYWRPEDHENLKRYHFV